MARSSSPHFAVPDTSVNEVSGRPLPPRKAPSLVVSLLVSLRPHQWTKNLLVFAALIFAQKLFNVAAVVAATETFAIFCALSGAVYLVNDVADRESDRKHPLKRMRPIAQGAVSVPLALAVAVALSAGALAGAFLIRWQLGAVSATYLVLLVLYSALLKHIVILDALTIAIGFVLRAAAGGAAIDVAISHWLFVCTILGALFIALAKRRHELILLADEATSHRPILEEYTPYLLDQMISVVTASTLIVYIFYTFSAETIQKFGTEWLGLTIPFPIYGIFRYLYLMHQKEAGGSPAELILHDRPLFTCILLWGAAVILIIYG